MANKSSFLSELSKETVFTTVVHRIPALIYLGDDKILSFAEHKMSTKNAGPAVLDMRAGKVNRNKGTDPEVTIKWSELNPVKEAQLPGCHPMNPCPVYEKDSKTLFLFFICVKDGVTEQWQISNNKNETHLCYIKSTDDGQNWSKVTVFTENELVEIKHWAAMAVGPGHGIQMESGRLIVPLYAYYRKNSSRFSLCLYSDDQGKSWRLGNKLKTDSNECEMAEVFDDKGNSILYCNARNKKNRVEAVSYDGGEEFPCSCDNKSKLVDTDTGCQGSVVSFPDQSEVQPVRNKWLLYSHPTDKNRNNLGVYLNKTPQDPTQWSKPSIINSGPSAYSDLAYIDDGWFVCLMECGKLTEVDQIACRVFNYNDVEQAIAE
ncbi:sialidase-3-like [Scomber japonicus]|uniref:sialidase-3-like n=1 Tax=Scomber japonicus TaxID=13676 RepID=UPI00230610B3|nr:sialidase-3-like [Scomber japonicus]